MYLKIALHISQTTLLFETCLLINLLVLAVFTRGHCFNDVIIFTDFT